MNCSGATACASVGNPCTADSCDATNGVAHQPVLAGTSCADANQCNGAEACNASGSCVAGTPPVVEDGNPCTVDACDPETGVSHQSAAAGSSCADADLCNGDEVCNASGACQPSAAPELDDGNPCTADSCESDLGVLHVALDPGTSCSDGNLCNGAESCDAQGSCGVGVPLPTPPSSGCVTYTCDPVLGVVSDQAPEGTVCSVDACTSGACTNEGECIATSAVDTDDGDDCTIDRCDPELGPVHIECSRIDPNVSSTIFSTMQWIYTGPNAVQTGVTPGAIDPRRAALLRGQVTTREGTPIPSVVIKVVGFPQFGQTTTHSNGSFDMVVNGGGAFELTFEKEGYLSSARTATPPWNGSFTVDDVILIPPDPIVTVVDLPPGGTVMQIARGSVVTDDAGTRESRTMLERVRRQCSFPLA
jgi:hypothetical protein